MVKIASFVFVGLLSTLAFAKDKASLRMAIPSTLGEPFLIQQGNGEFSGVVKDYMDLIGKHLNMHVETMVVPKFRIDELITRNMADGNCFTSPEWVRQPDRFLWSKPLFMKREVIVSVKHPPTSLMALKGKRLGTVLRYIYPKIDPLLADGTIVREDAPTEQLNLEKMSKGRLDYAVVDEANLNYFLKKNKDFKIASARFLVEEYPIHCLIPKDGPLTLNQLNKAIDNLKSAKEIEKVLEKYR